MTEGQIILTVLLPLASFFIGVYFNSRSVKRQDEEALKKEVARETAVDVKLDNIIQTTTSINLEVKQMRGDISALQMELSVMKERFHEHDKEIGELKDNLSKLHKEHRERVAHCEAIQDCLHHQ